MGMPLTRETVLPFLYYMGLNSGIGDILTYYYKYLYTKKFTLYLVGQKINKIFSAKF